MKSKQQPSDSYVTIGVISKAFGIKGAVAIHLFHPRGETLRKGLRLHLLSKVPRDYTIVSVKDGGRVELEGITDRNEAELLAGTTVQVHRDDFLPLEEDEMYLIDVLGYAVKDRQGNLLGKIDAFSDNTAQVLANLRLPNGKEALVPFIAEFIVQIDDDTQSVVMDLPEGLLE